MPPRIRISPQTVQVLKTFLSSPTTWAYGYDMSRDCGLKSGTLYPILMRLHLNKLLETKWEPSPQQGRPPRHMYRLTADGARFARTTLAERGVRRVIVRQALGEGGAP